MDFCAERHSVKSQQPCRPLSSPHSTIKAIKTSGHAAKFLTEIFMQVGTCCSLICEKTKKNLADLADLLRSDSTLICSEPRRPAAKFFSPPLHPSLLPSSTSMSLSPLKPDSGLESAQVRAQRRNFFTQRLQADVYLTSLVGGMLGG